MVVLTNFKLIITVSLAGSLILIFTEGSRFKEKIKFLLGVMVLCFLIESISPLFAELEKIADIFPNDETVDSDIGTSDDNVVKETARQMSIYIKDMICGKFSFEDEGVNVSVSLEFSDGEVNIKTVTVSVLTKYMSSAKDISDYVSSLIGCECTIIEF